MYRFELCFIVRKKKYIYHITCLPGYKPVGFIIPIEDFENKFMIGYGSDLAAVTWDGQSDQVSKLVIVENVETMSDNRISDGKISPQGILFVGINCFYFWASMHA